jgi:hypothetical protein
MIDFKLLGDRGVRRLYLRRVVSSGIACALALSPYGRVALAGPPFLEFVDPNPSPGNRFGATVLTLSTGNVVITAPFDDAAGSDAGAVYLFNGATGVRISTLLGSSANDNLGSGGVIALGNGNGNYVILSPNFDNGGAADAGAVTWGSGTLGIAGAADASNSLIGSTASDRVGEGGISTLTNGNYVVSSPNWDGGAADVGAATWGSGTTGVSGVVSLANSLIGSTTLDKVGESGIAILANGNYVVRSGNWDGSAVDVGAATWASGAAGLTGLVSSANSLVGSTADDHISNGCVAALTNGNYVVRSSDWDNGSIVDAGAVTWGDGATGISGAVSPTNSLVGSTDFDAIGNGCVTALPVNGNFVVVSPVWDDTGAGVVDAGAVTWVNGTTGITGPVSAANSLVGAAASDVVGAFGVSALTQGNFVVVSPLWGGGLGAATWVSGTTGLAGAVSSANSLVGSAVGDFVGFDGVVPLQNGNYLVRSGDWTNAAAVAAGAVTWGNGATGIVGAVTTANSLAGTTTFDLVGGAGRIRALTNGNYVVTSPIWDGPSAADVGAATWGNGTSGTAGPVSAANSLVGSTANDNVGDDVIALSNDNYVVTSPRWDGAAIDVGAATWGNGTTGTVGVVSSANSLVGSLANDRVGQGGVTALTNGNYVVESQRWNGAGANSGAVTWGNGATGTTGVVSSANSLVGSRNGDRVGSGGIRALPNGNYVVRSERWRGVASDAGAATWGSGTVGVKGSVNASNSLTGTVGGANLQPIVLDSVNGTFLAPFIDDNSGKVKVGSQADGSVPVLGAAAASNVTTTTADLSGSVTSDGGLGITSRGFVYSVTATDANPTLGASGVTQVPLAGTTGAMTTTASGLASGTGYSFRTFATNGAGTTYTPAQTFTTLGAPILNSPSSSGVTSTAATLGGTVSSDGASTITERGVVYSLTTTNADPVILGTGVTKEIVSGTTGAFTTGIAGLTPGANYSFKAFATNAIGTNYTTVGTFQTLAVSPSVGSPSSSSVGLSTATLGANVTSDGGAAITQRGFVFSPTATDSNPLLGSAAVTASIVSGTTGALSSSLSGLASGVAYTFKAFATNSVGTSYTSGGTFTTLAVPAISGSSMSGITDSTATLGGDVTSDGGSTITERGVVYSLTASDANPTIGSPGVTKAVASGTTGTFTAPVTGLAPGANYSFRAFATNAMGTAYTSPRTFVTLALPTISGGSSSSVGLSSATLSASATSDGGSAITQRGFVYSLTATDGNPGIGNPGVTTSAVAGTTGSFASSVTGLSPGASYSFKAFATNAVGTAYTSVGTFQTLALPVATTAAATSVGLSAATLNGSVNPTGFSTTVLFEYGLSTSYGTQATAGPAPGSGSAPVNVNAAITGLTCSSTYHFRLVATNAGGTANGADRTFTTSTCQGLAIDDPSIAEGSNGSSILAFTVSIPQALTSDVRVDYSTVAGTATAGDDYTAASGVFTLPAGSTSKTLNVLVRGEATAIEPDETLTVVLSNAVGTSIGKSTSTGTILNDDPHAAATTVTQYRLYHGGTLEHLYTTDLNEYNVLSANGWTQEGVAYKMLTNGVYNGVAATIPMFRLYHPGIQQHHWTTDANEAITLGRLPQWYFEGTIGYLLPTQAAGSVPLYRLALANPALHLWTTDQNEYETLGARGWIKEGIVGYVVP